MQLGADGQLGHRENVVLFHGGFGASGYVVDDQRVVVRNRQRDAVDVVAPRAVDDEEMVFAGSPVNVHIFSNLDIAIGAEDRQAVVAGGVRKTVGEYQLDPEKAFGGGTAQEYLAEFLKPRMRGIGEVADGAGNDFGIRRIGKIEEVVDLRRSKFGEDASRSLRFEEPRGAGK